MTSTLTDVPAPAPPVAQEARRPIKVQPVLEKLFGLYPHLFGAEFLPLKLGTFQDLLEQHPDVFDRAELKAALGVHARSTRYLQSIAAGKMRHDLAGQAVERVAPEHIHLAVLELFRRRQARTDDDLRPKLRRQLMAVFESSGMARQDYIALVATRDPVATVVLDEAFAERDAMTARCEALRKAFVASGKSRAEFADMYGMDLREVNAALGPQSPALAV